MCKKVSAGCMLLCGLLLSCGQPERVDIGVLLPETHVGRWKRDGAALKAEAEALGYSIALAYANADQGQQNRQIQDFVTRKARLLIVAAVSRGVSDAVAEAVRQGTQILAYDRLILGSADYDYYVSFDNFEVGRMQGAAILKGLQGKTETQNLVLFAGAITDNNTKFFFDGAMSHLLPAIRGERIRVVGPAPTSSRAPQFSRVTVENWRPEVAKSRMEGMLVGSARSLRLAAVLAPNDSVAQAIIAALRLDSKYSTPETFPVVTGQDTELESVRLLLDGWQAMTVLKDSKKLARAAVELGDGLLKRQHLPSVPGVKVDKFSYHTGLKAVTAYLLPPQLIDKENVMLEWQQGELPAS